VFLIPALPFPPCPVHLPSFAPEDEGVISLPGYAWLKRQLASVEEVEGPRYLATAKAVSTGAALTVSLFFILIWLVALLPLCLWVLGSSAFNRFANPGRTRE